MNFPKHFCSYRYIESIKIMTRLKIKEILKSGKAGSEVVAKGWVRTKRGSKNVNFIALNEKQKVFDDLKQQFLDSGLGYISSPVFPVKLIKRNYVLAQRDETNRLNKEAYFKNMKK